MLPGLFVTGTDTGVGKTLVSCALLRLLRERGVDAVGFKPVVTGAENGRWEDVEALWEASGRCEPRELIGPLRFLAPMAPVQAAKGEGREPDLGLARGALAELAGRHALVVAEGVGGLLVPLDRKTMLLDFIQATGYPAILVSRAGLGTVNHTLLSLRELERAGVPVAAVIMSVTRSEDAPNARPSIEEIERHSGMRIAALLPYGGSEAQDLARTSLREQLNLEGLIGGGMEGWRDGSHPESLRSSTS